MFTNGRGYEHKISVRHMSMAMACILSIAALDRLDWGDSKGFRRPENLCTFSSLPLRQGI